MTAWPRPVWARYDTQPVNPVDRREWLVEQMLRLGSDEYSETEWAVAVLRTIRPDLDTAHVIEQVHELLHLAEEVARWDGAPGMTRAFHCAADAYQDALFTFCTGPTTTAAGLTALADAVFGTAPRAPRDELAARRGR